MITKYLSKKLLTRLEEKKGALDRIRPLPKAALEKLRSQIVVEWTYNSNALEGNTLTLKETRLVLEHGITIAGKSLREHFEATNHKEAIFYLEGLVKTRAITEEEILKIHALVLKNIEREFAGRYRRGQVRILGAQHLPPNCLKVPGLINELAGWIAKNPDDLHIVELAAMAHYKFVKIHPFYDGNGRTARLLMNLILMRRGWPPAVLAVRDRKRYYNALAKADKGDYVPFVNLAAQAAESMLNLYLSAAGKWETPLLPLIELAPKTSYSAEYLSLLARRGELDAEKRGKTWYSTLEAVRQYRDQRQRNR